MKELLNKIADMYLETREEPERMSHIDEIMLLMLNDRIRESEEIKSIFFTFFTILQLSFVYPEMKDKMIKIMELLDEC
jgi:hypothetical protein